MADEAVFTKLLEKQVSLTKNIKNLFYVPSFNSSVTSEPPQRQKVRDDSIEDGPVRQIVRCRTGPPCWELIPGASEKVYKFGLRTDLCPLPYFNCTVSLQLIHMRTYRRTKELAPNV